MTPQLATTLHIASAAACVVLGAVVLLQNPHRKSHRVFALLAFTLSLWAVGVALIIQARSVETARLWVRATFIAAAFLPGCFQTFLGIVPHQRYEGPRWPLISLWLAAPVLIVGAFSPWHVTGISMPSGGPPLVEYGFVFYIFAFVVGMTMVSSYAVLFSKHRRAAGLERRQLEHVILGVALFTTLASITNVLLPLFNISYPQAYGPVFLVTMLAIFAYSMIRYNLLDVKAILTRTTVAIVSVAFITGVFYAAQTLVCRLLEIDNREGLVLPAVLAALIIFLLNEPLKERVKSGLERTVFKRGYDIHEILARATRKATQTVKLDELLRTVCEDVRTSVGITAIRVYLVGGKDPNLLIVEYSSEPGEERTQTWEHAELLTYLREHPEPLVLKRLIHMRANEERAEVAKHLAELDAYVCLPLAGKSGLVGIIALREKTSRDMYTSEDVIALSTLADALVTAIENARLYRELEEANLHRHRILTTMRGAVVAVDSEGRITTANEAARDMVGEAKVGEQMDSLRPPVPEILARTLDTGQAISDFETTILGDDNDRLPVAISSAPLPSAPLPSGETNGYSGAMVMIYDLSQVKRLEHNVQRAHRLSSIGTLAAGMAHEIKNPLVSIKTFTQLLLTRYDDPDFRATCTEVVPREVERIDSILGQLLDFARTKPASYGHRDLRRVINQVVMLVENQVRKAGIEIDLEFPSGPLEVFGDEQQLHQVFLNLVLNAIDAMRHTGGGKLRIDARRDHMHLRRGGNVPMAIVPCVAVAVRDTGCGIPPEELDGIFAPFFTTKENGTGLGLSVVHGIVTEHGGQIDVESTPDKGTVMTVSLPSVPTLAPAGDE